MKTTNKEKIEKAKQLWKLIQQRRDIEKAEAELKDYFKVEAKEGVLEAENVIILIENKSRTSLDRKKLELVLGNRISQFETHTIYQQVTVKAKEAA